MRIFPQEIRRLHRMLTGRVVGTTAGLRRGQRTADGSGRFLRQEDDDDIATTSPSSARSIADRLFPFEDPLGQTLKLGSHPLRRRRRARATACRIGDSGGSKPPEDFNNDVYIPLNDLPGASATPSRIARPARSSASRCELSQVTLTVADIDKVRPTGDLIEAILERITEDRLGGHVPLDRLEEAERAKRPLHRAAGDDRRHLAAGRRHRHHEHHAGHGDRADARDRHPPRLGAKRRDITMQFLIEAVVQTTMGGTARHDNGSVRRLCRAADRAMVEHRASAGPGHRVSDLSGAGRWPSPSAWIWSVSGLSRRHARSHRGASRVGQ